MSAAGEQRGGGPGAEEPTLEFPDPAAWRAWLERNHDQLGGAWLRIAKRGSGHVSVTHSDALDVAIAFGWIDATRRAESDTHFLQRFTRRRPRSRWSQVNRERAMALIAAGLMHPAGQAEIDRARADGRWDAAYQPQSRAAIPDDLAAEFEENPAAREFFNTLDSRNRYAILYRLDEARRPETRRRRLEKFVAMLNNGQKIHPQA